MRESSPDPAGAPPNDGQLNQALRELSFTLHHRVPERVGAVRLPSSELVVLKQIADAPGSTVNEIAESLGLRQPNASAAVTSLVRRGLVTREQSPADRRVFHLRPTEDGLAEHRAMTRAWAEALDLNLAGLTDEQRARLAAVADDLTALLELVRRMPRP